MSLSVAKLLIKYRGKKPTRALMRAMLAEVSEHRVRLRFASRSGTFRPQEGSADSFRRVVTLYPRGATIGVFLHELAHVIDPTSGRWTSMPQWQVEAGIEALAVQWLRQMWPHLARRGSKASVMSRTYLRRIVLQIASNDTWWRREFSPDVLRIAGFYEDPLACKLRDWHLIPEGIAALQAEEELPF